ncbi:MAG: nucleotidyltransferase domain-containing protein [Dehalococcoidia bacterium]
MQPGIDPRIWSIARSVARSAMGHGALAVVLSGSHARGDAHAASDIDLIVVLAKRPSDSDRRGWLRPYRRRDGALVSLAWETARSTQASFRDPRLAPVFVPGWREAMIIADPPGVAARLQQAARRWTWESIADACDRWAAEHVTGLAEEVHKLAGTYARGQRHVAAAQRSILAVHLAAPIAVRRRILFGTDNALWDLVAERMGETWASVQARALAEGGESFDESCRAALELYALAAREVRPLLDAEQRAVVDGAIGEVAARTRPASGGSASGPAPRRPRRSR